MAVHTLRYTTPAGTTSATPGLASLAQALRVPSSALLRQSRGDTADAPV